MKNDTLAAGPHEITYRIPACKLCSGEKIRKSEEHENCYSLCPKCAGKGIAETLEIPISNKACPRLLTSLARGITLKVLLPELQKICLPDEAKIYLMARMSREPDLLSKPVTFKEFKNGKRPAMPKAVLPKKRAAVVPA